MLLKSVLSKEVMNHNAAAELPALLPSIVRSSLCFDPTGGRAFKGNCDMTPVRISDLIEALEFDSDEDGNWVNLQNGSVVRLAHSLISAVEEGDEAALESMADWEKEEVEDARAIVGDSGERFVVAPSKLDFHEYRQMERFIGTVADAGAAEQLWRAVKGKGAFRYFKDTASRLGLLQQWYHYRDNAMKEFVRDWAEAQQIPVVDDTAPNPQA